MTDISEKATSPDITQDSNGNATSATRTFNVLNELDEATALADFKAFLSNTFIGVSLQNSNLQQIEGLDGWVGTANYSNEGTKTENQVLSGTGIVERFDISSRTVRTMQSKGTVNYDTSDPGETSANKNKATTPDFKNLIQVNNDGTVQGVDIEISQLGFTLSKQYLASDIDNAFKRKLIEAMNSVNELDFRGWHAGEVRLLAVQDQDAGSNKVNLTYRFLVSQNARDGTGDLPDPGINNVLKVGDIEGITKFGHEFLWVKYQEERNVNSSTVIKVPQFVYIERVYDTFDFDDPVLGIK